MSTDWNAFLNTQGFTADGDFGAAADELNAASQGPVLSPLIDQGLIRASGPDAAEFLHNLMTNDVKGIGAGNARFAGFCTAKGRLLATLLIWRDGEDLILMLARDIHAAILKKLSMYVLRSKVKLSDATADFALIGYKGAVPPAPTFAAGAGELTTYAAADIDDGKIIRLDTSRWLIVLKPDAAIKRWPELVATARTVCSTAWQWLEIVAGKPRVIAATQEAFVPQMLNMEHAAVAGVSFTKGCYPGQEIVARTQYLGKVKRRMYRAQLPQAFAAATHMPGTPVFSPETTDQHCGALVSVSAAPGGGYEALVCVQSTAVEAGAAHLGAPDGPRLAILELPYHVD